MTRISKRPVSQEVMDKVYLLLFETMGKKSSKSEFFMILSDILSPTEKIMIGKRIGIMFLLMKNIEYYVICDVLKVSTATVAKFHSILLESKAVRKSLKPIVRNERLVQFILDAWLTIRGPGVYGVNWQSAWKAKHALERWEERGI